LKSAWRQALPGRQYALTALDRQAAVVVPAWFVLSWAPADHWSLQ
jgi:hypothetical protein